MSCTCPPIYLDRARSLVPVHHRLFVSSRRPSRALSKNAVSFFWCEVIRAAGASRPELGSIRAHEIRSVSTSPSTGTGQSPRSWSPPLGAQVRCFPHFTCATFSMNTMAFARWVRSWLRVRGLSSPHLFLTCSWGGGGATSPLPPLLRGSCTCLSYWMWGLPIRFLCRFWGTPFVFLFVLPLYCYLTFFVSYVYLFYACPSLKCPVGLCYLDT